MSGTPPPGSKSPTLSKSNQRNPVLNRQLSTSTPASKRQHKARSKWHFGIRSRCPPWEVMLEIFKSLKNVGFVCHFHNNQRLVNPNMLILTFLQEWKVLDPYHLRCRYQYPSGIIVKVDLQLYKLDVNSYLVDFKSLGQVMAEGYCPQVSPNASNASNVSSDDMQLSDRFSDDFSYENTIRQVTFLSEQADASNESVLSTFPFLDVCSKLITELAISS